MRNGSKILVGALSASGYDIRRQSCRATWARTDDATSPDWDVVFLVGDTSRPLPVREGDILYVPCPDSYECLPQKTRWFCLWALSGNANWDWLFKCDDDTYVHQHRLREVVDSLSPSDRYVGHDLGQYASGGAGYLLHREAAISVVGRLLECTGAEDVLVGAVLRQADIRLTGTDRFHPWADAVPSLTNHLATGHYVAPRKMREIELDFRPSREIPRVFHFVWVGGRPLPENYVAYQQTWRKHHPEWQIRVWRDDDLRWLRNQSCFDSAPTPAQKADIARYEILERHGGVYVDCDFECYRSIEPLLNGVRAFSAEEDDHSIAIGIMGTEPGHPLWREVIDRLPASYASTSNPVIGTGPAFFTPIIREWPATIFRRELFYPVHYSGTVWGRLEQAFARHHWSKSWQTGGH